MNNFSSNFKPSKRAIKVLQEGLILGPNEKPQEMIERIADSIFNVEKNFGTPTNEIEKLKKQFGSLIDNKFCILNTAILTNAGRYNKKPLAACALPPIDLLKDFAKAEKIINSYHENGMGTGFDLNQTKDPVKTLKILNKIAIKGAESGREDRPVGNMATLSIHHPAILRFIDAKLNANREKWKFNISVDITDEFLQAVEKNSKYSLTNGKKLTAKEVFQKIAENAHICGDPGLVFLHRMNLDNPTPHVGRYTSTAPCAEVGLIPGESCQFGYINLGKFVKQKAINFKKLEKTTRLMTRILDNAVEVSLNNYPLEESKKVMQAKRKIGVGICGLADLLFDLEIPYDSPEARKVSTEIMNFINYISKVESHELAKSRGSFPAMNDPRCKHITSPSLIGRKYGDLNLQKITNKQWKKLDQTIKKTKLLRNASTTSLPPTGRSALVIDASTGIEPAFSLLDHGHIHPELIKHLKRHKLWNKKLEAQILADRTLKNIDKLPQRTKQIFKTALEIGYKDHILMAAALQKTVDESISKTINISFDKSPQDVFEIYKDAYKLGLKGVSVFRNLSRESQPRNLGN